MTSSLYDFDISYSGKFSSPIYIAGVDEAGRGSLAGPVVASAVVLDLSLIIPFLNDSKKLSPSRREGVFFKIREISVDIGLGVVEAGVIDEINILNASKLAMYKAISDLTLKPDIVLIDAVVLSDLKQSSYSIIKGDSISASIAAASIVAKCSRDSIMRDYESIFPAYSFAKHKGYPTKAHLKELRENGPTDIHRKTYKPVRELLNRED